MELTPARRLFPEAFRIAMPAGGTSEPHPELRQQGIGGSDVAAIVGLGEYGTTALDIFFAKRGTGPAARSPAMEEAARFGHLFEPVIAEEFAYRTGLRILPSPGMVANCERPWMRANLDRLVTSQPPARGRLPLDAKYPLEIKTRSAWKYQDWRDEPADAPAIQLMWYLAVTGATKGYLAALIGGNSLKWYEVPRNDELITMLIDAAEEFRGRLERDDPPPADGSRHTSALLDSIWLGTAGSVKFLSDDEAAEVRKQAGRARGMAETIKVAGVHQAEAENQIKLMMGDAEIAMHGSETLATWKRNGTFRSKDFMHEQPELAEQYTILRAAVDTRKLAADNPIMYTAYRARSLRLAAQGNDEE